MDANDDCEIIVNDPHNKDLLLKVNTFQNLKFIYKAIEKIKVYASISPSDVIVFPDKNAYKKYFKYIKGDKNLNIKNVIVLEKGRDVKTGKITEHKIYLSEITTPITYKSKFYIIDDICDKGGTFISAKKLISNEFKYVENSINA